jgi:hypothetical protein
MPGRAKRAGKNPALRSANSAHQRAATLEVIEAMTVEAILNCAWRSEIP